MSHRIGTLLAALSVLAVWLAPSLPDQVGSMIAYGLLSVALALIVADLVAYARHRDVEDERSDRLADAIADGIADGLADAVAEGILRGLAELGRIDRERDQAEKAEAPQPAPRPRHALDDLQTQAPAWFAPADPDLTGPLLAVGPR